MLERELRYIQDGRLILSTYQVMKGFWESSKRRFDKIIQHIFEVELANRELLMLDNENENDNDNDNDNDNENDNDNDNENHNENDNEGSYSTIRNPEKNSNRGTNRRVLINTDQLLPEEQVHLTRYLEFLKYQKPSFNRPVRTDEILDVFYEELIGELTAPVKEKIKLWDQQLSKSLILEAMVRSIDKYNPAAYIKTVIDNWLDQNVTNLRDVSRLDREFHRGN